MLLDRVSEVWPWWSGRGFRGGSATLSVGFRFSISQAGFSDTFFLLPDDMDIELGVTSLAPCRLAGHDALYRDNNGLNL